MTELYENDTRSAILEPQITGDFMVSFHDKNTSDTQYETFHTLEKAELAAKRWLEHTYVPL